MRQGTEPPDANQPADWITDLRARDLTGALTFALNALEPLGPFGAQLLYVAQPLLNVFGWRAAVAEVAQALDEPGGIDRLRARLRMTDAEGDPVDPEP